MTSRVVLRILDTPIVVETPDPGLANEVARLWAPFLSTNPSSADLSTATSLTPVGDGWQVTTAGRAPAHLASATAALLELGTVLNHRALDEVDAFAVHAGVVQVAGRCMALVARSGTGKSTLVAALVRAGADYVSDEALVVDRAGTQLLGYPRPLGLSPWSCAAVGLPLPTGGLPETLVAGAELGRVCVVDPGPLDLVVELTPPGEGPPEADTASKQAGAALLLQHSFNHWRAPAASFSTAHRLAAEARVLRLRPGAPAVTAELLLQLMTDQTAVPTHAR